MFKVNDKVLPIGYTKNSVGIGFIREIQEDTAFVYWTGIKSEGAWPIDQLKKA